MIPLLLAACREPDPIEPSAVVLNAVLARNDAGWTDPDGDGEWAVTIRCATAGPDGLDVYAGAGIVDGSDPQAELAETTAKLGTMLAALGVSHVAR